MKRIIRSDAEVAEPGQRRETQDLLPQGFAGSNPALRTSKKLNSESHGVRRENEENGFNFIFSRRNFDDPDSIFSNF